MPYRRTTWISTLALGWCAIAGQALGYQLPTTSDPGGMDSPFGSSPGGNASGPEDLAPPRDGPRGGRPGPSSPRSAPPSAERNVPRNRQAESTIQIPQVVPTEEQKAALPLDIPEGDEEATPGGMTLDQAIATLLQNNLELQALAYEIPLARADIITAGLRSNPFFYADTQLVPYGAYSERRPGGPVQYDINITHPFDLSGKRKARVRVACAIQKVVEAQYLDAARQAVGNLANAYVDVLGAVQTERAARASLNGLERLLKATDDLYRQGERSRPDLERVKAQREQAQLSVKQAEAEIARTQRELASLLQIAPEQAPKIVLGGKLNPGQFQVPPVQELSSLARASRPDLAAYRIGLVRADAEVHLAYANRFEDVQVLFQPYTFQDQSPFGKKSSHSWALGVTVPLPIYDRNQGNIRRAQLNVSQTRLELAARERRVDAEIHQAVGELESAQQSVSRLRDAVLPSAKRVRDDTQTQLQKGEADIIEFLRAQGELSDAVRLYRDAQVRLRRAMFALNTVLGYRLLP